MNTAFISNINWLAVIVGAIAYFMLGAVWYSKALFAKKWVAYQKINMDDPDTKKGVGQIMFGSFILMLVTTIGLALLAERLQMTRASSGIKLGLVTGICFSFTTISISYLYVKKPMALHFIDGMYHVVGQAIAASVICGWH